MRNINVLFLLPVILILGNNANAWMVTGKISKGSVKIGGLINFSVKVTGSNIQSVSWAAIDSLFINNKQIKLIDSKTIANHPGLYQHDFLFTALKPGKLVIGPTPVIIKSNDRINTIFTAKYDVHFVNDVLPLTVDDIKPISKYDVAFIWNLLIAVLFACCLIVLFFRLRHLLQFKRHEKKSLELIRNIYLKKLYLLEEQIINNHEPDNDISEYIFIIFKEYLNETTVGGFNDISKLSASETASLLKFNHAGTEYLNTLLNTSNNLRFSYKHALPLPLKAYVDEVKTFIKKYPISIA